AVYVDRVRRLFEHAAQPADPRSGQRYSPDPRQRRGWNVLRHNGVQAGHGSPVRERGPEHHAGPRSTESGFEPVPHLQTPTDGGSAVPGGGLQYHEHTSFLQSERKRQQLQLREDPIDRWELGDGALAAVSLWVPVSVLEFLCAGCRL